jgi:hypothetical protein
MKPLDVGHLEFLAKTPDLLYDADSSPKCNSAA